MLTMMRVDHFVLGLQCQIIMSVPAPFKITLMPSDGLSVYLEIDPSGLIWDDHPNDSIHCSCKINGQTVGNRKAAAKAYADLILSYVHNHNVNVIQQHASRN